MRSLPFSAKVLLTLGLVVWGIHGVLKVGEYIRKQHADVDISVKDAFNHHGLLKADVVLTGPDLYVSKTDDHGRCSFDDVLPGTYLVSVTHAGYYHRTDSLDVRANNAHHISYHLQPHGTY